MAMSPQAIQYLLRLLARRVGGASPASSRAAIAGLARGKKPSDMSRMLDKRGAGREGRSRPDFYDGADYPFGYKGPDPGDINELQQIQGIIQALGLEGRRRIKGAGRAGGATGSGTSPHSIDAMFNRSPFREQYRGDHNAMSRDSSILNQLLNNVPDEIDIKDLLGLIRGD